MVGGRRLRSGQEDPAALGPNADDRRGGAGAGPLSGEGGGAPPARGLELRALSGRYAVCRLTEGGVVPDWAVSGEFCSITRAPGELSIVCPEPQVPSDVTAERGWRALHVKGPLPFTLTGVVASLAGPLAQAGVPIFVVSTYDTDLLLVKEADLGRAASVLRGTGHRIAEV